MFCRGTAPSVDELKMCLCGLVVHMVSVYNGMTNHHVILIKCVLISSLCAQLRVYAVCSKMFVPKTALKCTTSILRLKLSILCVCCMRLFVRNIYYML